MVGVDLECRTCGTVVWVCDPHALGVCSHGPADARKPTQMEASGPRTLSESKTTRATQGIQKT